MARPEPGCPGLPPEGTMASKFEQLLNESFEEQVVPHEGDVINARVVEITPEFVFIHFGGKTEGIIDSAEFADGKPPEKGQRLRAIFLGSRNNEMRFTFRVGAGEINKGTLRAAYANQLPVLGRVANENNGGYRVAIGTGNSAQYAFCPFSQMDINRGKPEDYLGKQFSFKITEFQNNGRKLTVSRRSLLEEIRQETSEKLSEELEEGDTVDVTVMALKPFGAIVDLGGVDGLIPMSELAHERIKDAGEVVREGDQFPARILKLDWENKKISLSKKALLPDPWYEQMDFREGQIVKGKVSSIKAFGIFISLAPNIEGLVPNRETGLPEGTRLETKYEPGKEVEVFVMRIDREQKRISLSLRRAVESANRREMESYLTKQEDVGGGASLGDILKKKLDNG